MSALFDEIYSTMQMDFINNQNQIVITWYEFGLKKSKVFSFNQSEYIEIMFDADKKNAMMCETINIALGHAQ